MNGSAINQVLLNIPQGGNGSSRNSNTRDTDTADFAQAFQTQQANARAEQNQRVEKAQASARKKEIADNAATSRNNNRGNSVNDRALDKNGPQKADHSETTSAGNKVTATAKRKVSEPASNDQQAPAVDEGQQAVTNAAGPDARGDALQGETSKGQATDLEQTADTSSEAKATTETDASASLLSLQELLAGKTNTPDANMVADTAGATGANTGLVPGQLPAVAATVSTEDNETLITTTSGETHDLVQADGDTTENLLNPLGQAQSDSAVATAVAAQTTAAQGIAGQDVVVSDAGEAEAMVSTEAAGSFAGGPGSRNDASASTIQGVTDDLKTPMAAIPPKGEPQTGASSKTSTNSADINPAAGNDSAGVFDKSNFEKMVKTMTQSTLGDASSPDQQPAPPTSSSLNAGLEYPGRAQDSQGATGLRNFVVQTSVQTPVGQPQWSQAVGEKVLWLAAQNISSAEINLHPQDLGPVQVKVSVTQDQANVTFTSHHAVVREVLDQNLNRLRDMFSEQGLNLVNVDVSDRSFQRQQGEGKEQQGQGNKAASEVEDETPIAMSIITSQRLVDHYA